MKVGFIGLGRMGGGMAARLLAAGYDLAVFDRDAAQTARLGEQGAKVAADLADLAGDRDLVITMLPSDEILAQVTADLCAALPKGAIHMVSGTHGVLAIERGVAAHEAAGQTLIACTVLGRPDRAAEGKLGLIPAGPAQQVAAIRPLLQTLGETIFEPGPNPLSATAIKIANNFVLGCAIEAMGEGMALVRKYDVDPALFYDVLTQGLFKCIAYEAYGDVIAKEDWGRVGATATIGLKDVKLALEAAQRVSVPLPSGNVWRDHLVSAVGRGEANLDWAVMAREQFRASGLE